MTKPSEAMSTEKRSGPRTEPSGITVARCCDLDTSPLQDTLKDLSERLDSNHCSAVPEMPLTGGSGG